MPFLRLLWEEIAKYLVSIWSILTAEAPTIGWAFATLIAGYVVGKLASSLLRAFLVKGLGFDRWLEEKGLSNAAYGVSISALLAGLVKWYIYLLFVSTAVSMLDIPFITPFMQSLMEYLPFIIGAVLTLLIGLVIGEWLKIGVAKMRIPFRAEVGTAVKALTVYVFLLAALHTVGINVSVLIYVLLIIVAAVVLTAALIVGISIGLALKDEIRPYVKDYIKELSKATKQESE